jgi:site-specific recombinase XerD
VFQQKMDVPLQNQYKKFVKTLQQYEKVIGEKLQLRSIKIKDLKSFVDYLDSENYQTSTIERQIGRFRFS